MNRDWMDEYIEEQEKEKKRNEILTGILFCAVFVIALFVTAM